MSHEAELKPDPYPSSHRRSRVYVAGPPFSGKSTAGEILAGILGFPFADLDRLVEEATGAALHEIFREKGEVAFRELEKRCLAEAASREGNLVLAVGGGALLDRANLDLALTGGVLLTLWAAPAVLASRMSRDPAARPLSLNEASLLRLLRARESHYLSLPNRIDTSDLEVHEVAEEAAALVRRALLI
jgi:shikimate kinase